MSGHIGAGHEFRRVIPANLSAVEDFCMEARHWALSVQLPSRFAVELLTREAVTNAAVHGCFCNPSRQVTCTLRWRPGRVVIAVDDPGPGFDWRTEWMRIPSGQACSGRGMTILKRYAHRLRFNQRGNSLVMIKRLSKEGTR